MSDLPNTFSYIDQVVPNIRLDIRYYTSCNFIGKRLDGYLAPRAILTRKAAQSLKTVQDELASFNLGLKIYDAYRPQQTVDQFMRWIQDLNDTDTKSDYYPDIPKQHLLRDGYLAERSVHSRGSTVDLTIIDIETEKELNMGTPFDYFGPESWTRSNSITSQARANRLLLKTLMNQHGFKSLDKEWWHFTLRDEPYPDTYFNFSVK